ESFPCWKNYEEQIQRRIASHAAYFHSDRDGGDRVDVDDRRGHHHARSASEQRGRDRRCQPGYESVLHGFDLRWWSALRAGHARIASLWPQRLYGRESLPNQQYLSCARSDSAHDGRGVAVAVTNAPTGRPTRNHERDGPIPQRAELGNTATFALFRIAALSPGSEHGEAGDFRPGFLKYHQCALQLGIHLRALGLPRVWHSRFRMVHLPRAHLYGTGSADRACDR